MNISLTPLIVGIMCLSAHVGLGQTADEKVGKVPDKMVQATSMALLQHVMPSLKNASALKEMKFETGSIQWGPLFRKDEIMAFVFLGKDGERSYEVPIPKQVSLYAWDGGHWTFCQSLGELNQITIGHCRRFPFGIVQGSLQVERHGAEQSSWRYDEKSRRLIPTDWGFWGPAYVVGDYVISTRGIERLAHDDTHWIYPLVGNRSGELLCSLDANDGGPFAVTVRDRKSGELRRWKFVDREFREPDNRSPSKIPVTIYRLKQERDEGECMGTGELTMEVGDELDIGYCFTLLTGLSDKILDNTWRDELPKAVLHRVPIQVTGAKEIVDAFQWPKPQPKSSH